MARQHIMDEDDFARLLAENYEQIEMEPVFRRDLQGRTRRMVAGRGRRAVRLRWLTAAAVGLAVAAALIWWHPGRPSSPIVAEKPGVRNRRSNEPPRSAQNSPHRPIVPPHRDQVHHGNRRPSADTALGPHGGNAPMIPTSDDRKLVADRGPAGPADDRQAFAVIAAQPPVTDASGRALAAGDRLEPGGTLRTGRGGRVTLVARHASQLDLDSESELTVSPSGVLTLQRGRLFCSNRDAEIRRIRTSAGEIELLGTVVDAAVLKMDTVAVTVVRGRVELANSRGRALVDAGRRSVLSANLSPQAGAPVNTFAETAWCDRRGDVTSDFGDITYTVEREKNLVTEVWAVKADGTGKRRVRSFIGEVRGIGPWLPGQQWLLIETFSPGFTLPDYSRRTANAGTNCEILRYQRWFLNAVTGQDVPMQIPVRYAPTFMSFSPDSRKLSFTGIYHFPPWWTDTRPGVWLYDLKTGQVTQILDRMANCAPSFAPDGSRIVVCAIEKPDAAGRLTLIDTQTLAATDLGIEGSQPSLSPNGERLAYLGDITPGPVPPRASIFVLDLERRDPVRITPKDEPVSEPRWCPDGTRILYRHLDRGICVVRADGSQPMLVCPKERWDGADLRSTVGSSPCLAWTPSGDGVIVSTVKGPLILAADGSGLRANLSDEHGGELTAREESQTEGAVAALREAVLRFAAGWVSAFDGKPKESREHMRAAADIFAGLMWEYPLAGFGANDVLRYADKATELANRPSEKVIADGCWEHMRFIRGLMGYYFERTNAVPPDLVSLIEWARKNDWPAINWLSREDEEHLSRIIYCPATGQAAYGYTVPPAGALPRERDVLVTCPFHRSYKIDWLTISGKTRPMIWPYEPYPN